MNKNKGFTLIELLVVIAIIGILSSVVLASLGTARDKGKDASVKSQMANMRAQAELYYSANESYTGLCTESQEDNGFGGWGGPGLLSAVDSSVSITHEQNLDIDVAGDYNVITCHVSKDGESWAVEAPLVDSVFASEVMYCVDSTGTSKTVTGSSQSLANLGVDDSACK